MRITLLLTSFLLGIASIRTEATPEQDLCIKNTDFDFKCCIYDGDKELLYTAPSDYKQQPKDARKECVDFLKKMAATGKDGKPDPRVKQFGVRVCKWDSWTYKRDCTWPDWWVGTLKEEMGSKSTVKTLPTPRHPSH
jgi:hypothetical protein